MKNKVCGIYMIQSKRKHNYCYIGSAANMRKRWQTHLAYLKRGDHHSRRLQNHYNKYGKEDLEFSLLLTCEKTELIEREQFFIDAYNPWFNLCKKAGSFLGRKHSEETKTLLRKINLGKKLSEETKRKIGESSKGNKYNLGKKLSEERRKQITEQVRGRKLKPRTEEHCRRLSISHLGQKAWNKGMQNIYSEESLQKMRDAKKGNNWNIGNKMSQESIDKMSKAKKGKITWNKGLKYKILKYHSDINMN